MADLIFSLVHGHNLVYNTCWEDPRLDREALELGPDDRVAMITSAGCNALDYALDRPAHILAVDLNPRQNALLELKQAAIRSLSWHDAFDLFGRGQFTRWTDAYQSVLRYQLSPSAQQYWDRHSHYFASPNGQRTFYFRGTSGLVARTVNAYLDRLGLRHDVHALLDAASIEEQQRIYHDRLKTRLWRPWLRWFARQRLVLTLLAVPPSQRAHLERDYAGGVGEFIERRIEAVFTTLPIRDNYFWRVYLTGRYEPDCCPSYLTRPAFDRLKAGLVDRITTATGSLAHVLAENPSRITRFVLLDHMDWMCENLAALRTEWIQILRRATPGARILWRSGGRHTAFVEALAVPDGRGTARLGDRLVFDRARAEHLHARDRVHTYGSFHIATVNA